MASRNAVQRTFDAYGKSEFAEKRSGTWRRRVGEVEQSLNLQKSQYSLRYYLNVELALPDEDPRAYIRGRAGALLAEADRARLEALLDLDGRVIPEEQREAELLGLLGSLTPVLNEFTSVADLAAHDRRRTFNAMGVTGPARAAMDRA